MLTIHKASAGSGKTYNLAYEYIKLLLGKRLDDGKYTLNRDTHHNSHRKILAITFTNKATGEMKSRILKQLDSLTRLPKPGQKDAEYASKLMEEFGCSREELQMAAKLSLRRILNDYSSFNISTIDSFFQSVLRSFAHEIERQGDFRLELDGKTALMQSISLLFDELNLNPNTEANQAIFNWLNDLSSERLAEGVDYNPFNRQGSMYKEILYTIRSIFNETFAQNEEKINTYFSNPQNLGDFGRWLEANIRKLKEDIALATANLKPLSARLNRYAKPRFDMVEAEKISSFSKAASGKVFNVFLDDNKKYLIAMREMDKSVFSGPPTEEELKIAKEWVDAIDRGLQMGSVYEQMLHGVSALWAIHYIYDFIDRYRQENNLILISDSNSLLQTIINGSETPFIYEKIGLQLENYLIDEFQDTSKMQWDNLLPLVENQISDAESLIIGDVKQAIFQFRGGVSDLLDHEVQDHFGSLAHIVGEEAGSNTNYRSAHDMVRFNNTLFHNLANLSPRPVTGYEGVEQALAQQGTEKLSAWIRINNLASSDITSIAKEMLGEEAYSSLAAEGNVDAEEVALKALGENILDQINRGYMQREIAILCRGNDAASRVAEYISRNYGNPTDGRPAIKLVSEESLLLKNSQAVKLIISVLEIIDRSLETNDKNEESLTEAIERTTLIETDEEREKILKLYKRRRKRATLADNFEYNLSNGDPLNVALSKAIEAAERVAAGGNSKDGDHKEEGELDEHDGIDDIADTLAKIRSLAPPTLSALIQAIIKMKIPAEMQKAELPYIASFLDLVNEFMENFIPSVHSFLGFWGQYKDHAAILPGERENAVTISTVHKAKGLEWKCVHIPLLYWKYEQTPQSAWFDTSKLDCAPIAAPDGKLIHATPPPIMYLNTSASFNGEGSPLKEQYDRMCRENLIDNVNIAYVAFTRAISELYVNILPSKNSNIGKEIWAILQNSDFPAVKNSGNYIDFSRYRHENYFEIGAPTHPTEKSSEPELPSSEAPEFSVCFDNLNDRVTDISRFLSQAPTAQGDFDAEEQDREDEEKRLKKEKGQLPNPKLEQATEDGKMLHSILSRMHVVDDLDLAVSIHAKYCSPEQLNKYHAILSEAFNKGDEKVLEWFDSQNRRVLNEQSIYNPATGKTTRADRIVWLADGSVEVVDYKFTVDDDDDEHKNQVKAYGNALRQMDLPGNPRVSAWLWYPFSSTIIEVPLDD